MFLHFSRATLKSFFYVVAFAISLLTINACSKVDSNKLDKTWIPGWKLTTAMNVARAGAAVVVYENVIYMIGGVDGSVFLSSVESAIIQKDGSLSTWKLVGDMPEPRGFISAIVHQHRLYVVGGGNGKYGENLLNTVVSAELLKNGKIGKWRQEEQRLLLPRRCSKLIKNGNVLLALGGFGGNLLDTVEVATFDAQGRLGPWQMAQEKLTMPRYVNSVTQVGNKTFVLGGHHPHKGVGLKEVEFADLTVSPLKWRRTNSMIVPRYAFSSFSYQGYLFAAGGISGSEYLDSIEVARTDIDNETLSWRDANNLPFSMANFTTKVVNDRVYLIGGSANEVYLNSVWYAEFDQNAHLGYWGSTQELDAFKKRRVNVKKTNKLPNSGLVLNIINTAGYTYLLVKNKSSVNNAVEGNTQWVAAPKMEISNNTQIQYSEGVFMSNFYSKTLNKTFKSVLFVGTVIVLEETSQQGQ